jgi:tellurite methyltransferase
MKGVEAFGKPRRPRFILQPDELKNVFHTFRVVEYREATIEDGRPVQLLVAQKPLSQ